jgi:hypothetical protein
MQAVKWAVIQKVDIILISWPITNMLSKNEMQEFSTLIGDVGTKAILLCVQPELPDTPYEHKTFITESLLHVNPSGSMLTGNRLRDYYFKGEAKLRNGGTQEAIALEAGVTALILLCFAAARDYDGFEEFKKPQIMRKFFASLILKGGFAGFIRMLDDALRTSDPLGAVVQQFRRELAVTTQC